MHVVLRTVLPLLAASATAHAAPTAVDTLLCLRTDTRFGEEHIYLSVARTPQVPNVTTEDGGKVTVCQDAEKQRCTSFTTKGYGFEVNADGSLLVGDVGDRLAVMSAKNGKVKARIANRRAKDYSCGGGSWMGDAILALGANCGEFDSQPFLANGKTGKYIAPFVDDSFTLNAEGVYDIAPLGGKLWAVAAFDHYKTDELGLGTVYVIDVSNGKVKATVQGEGGGAATVTEGKRKRPLTAIAACTQ